MLVDGQDVMPAVKKVLLQMRNFSDAIRNGKRTGYTGKPITDVVNIGVGGSDLGTAMVCEALSPYASDNINVHFLSNIDGNHFQQITKKIKPETTLFVIASKTFTTQETMVNAVSARRWLLDSLGDTKAVKNHFVAISSNIEAATKFGVAEENVFEFWDWVGGRFSLWSAIGLPIALYIGMDKFEELLAGAHEMDEHFINTDYRQNLPVIMAMLGIWYINFFGVRAHAVMPYDQHLHDLPAYLCQAEMESNGKGVDRQGKAVDYLTAPIVFGDAGTDGQHSFYQLLHQGTQFTTSDFIVAAMPDHDLPEHHEILASNYFAQTEAFMNGRNEKDSMRSLKQQKYDDESIQQLLAYKKFAGDKPSTSIMYKKLTPNTLGKLIALYEHKIFIQGVIWNVNSFDQMGVELGKELARAIQSELHVTKKTSAHDSSTNGLINYYKYLRNS
jgi:glucose-6-phosphate isomerase